MRLLGFQGVKVLPFLDTEFPWPSLKSDDHELSVFNVVVDSNFFRLKFISTRKG